MKYIICFIALTILLLSCSTPYQPKGLLGGYSDCKIADNIYVISFWGNQHSEPGIIDKYLLYRCAEFAIENNHKYFAVIGGKRECDNRSYFAVGSGQSTGGNNRSNSRAYSNIRITEYDFNNIILLSEVKDESTYKMYDAKKTVEDLSSIINN